MTTPDFSRSPEHVALAQAIGAVYSPRDKWEDFTPHMKGQLLMFADAAITFLGAGIPPATEENARRLASMVNHKCLSIMDRTGIALLHLRALHAMMAEKPEPAPEKPCNCADCSPANWPETNGWRCGKKKPEPECSTCGKPKRPNGPQTCSNAFHLPDKPEPRPYPPGPTPCGDAEVIPPSGARPDGALVTHVVPEPRDITGDAERRRERQKLVWEAMLAAISGPAALQIGSDHLVKAGEFCADAYLAWRDADEAAAKERVCKR